MSGNGTPPEGRSRSASPAEGREWLDGLRSREVGRDQAGDSKACEQDCVFDVRARGRRSEDLEHADGIECSNHEEDDRKDPEANRKWS